MCCIFTINPKLPLLFQADPTKVETVHDVLARAAAKGLLGGIIPEQSKSSKKGKSKKDCVASPTSKPPSPSSDERLIGSQLVSGQDPDAPSQIGEKDEDLSSSEEEGKEEKTEEADKGHKRKIKRPSKQTHKSKKKATKKKVKQSNHRKHQTKSKPRRIPRLTLTLMSSAKTSKHLSPITAIAHKLSDNSTAQSQQPVFSTPSSAGEHPAAAPPAPNKHVRRPKTQPEEREEKRKEAKLLNSSEARRKLIRPEDEALKATDLVFPPISCPSYSSLHNKSGSSSPQPLYHTSHTQSSNMSASSSTVCLPEL